jgi:hypothetical protein
MKTPILISALIFMTSIFSHAQDLLILKTGEDINAKIVEVGSQEVKYKKFENIDGPTYTISKDKIFMIKYQNGTKETFDNESGNTATEQKPVLKSPPVQQQKQIQLADSQSKLRKGRVLTGLGSSFVGMGSVLLASGGAVYAVSYDYYTGYYDDIAEVNGLIMMSVGGAVFTAGLPMMITGLVKKGSAKKEIRLSNNSGASMIISPTFMPANYTKSGSAPGLYVKVKF